MQQGLGDGEGEGSETEAISKCKVDWSPPSLGEAAGSAVLLRQLMEAWKE